MCLRMGSLRDRNVLYIALAVDKGRYHLIGTLLILVLARYRSHRIPQQHAYSLHRADLIGPRVYLVRSSAQKQWHNISLLSCSPRRYRLAQCERLESIQCHRQRAAHCDYSIGTALSWRFLRRRNMQELEITMGLPMDPVCYASRDLQRSVTDHFIARKTLRRSTSPGFRTAPVTHSVPLTRHARWAISSPTR